jgi:hypothetical protein
MGVGRRIAEHLNIGGLGHCNSDLTRSSQSATPDFRGPGNRVVVDLIRNQSR